MKHTQVLIHTTHACTRSCLAWHTFYTFNFGINPTDAPLFVSHLFKLCLNSPRDVAGIKNNGVTYFFILKTFPLLWSFIFYYFYLNPSPLSLLYTIKVVLFLSDISLHASKASSTATHVRVVFFIYIFLLLSITAKKCVISLWFFGGTYYVSLAIRMYFCI